MSYRIARITNLYSEYLNQYRTTFPTIGEKSFQEQYHHLISDSFDTASSISKDLRNIGIDAFDIFTNVKELQNRWKFENDCQKSGRELLLEQMKVLRPDVVWIDNPTAVDQKWILNLREKVKSVRIVTGLVCAPYSSEDINTLRAFDFVVTCTPCLKKEMENSGLQSELLYHGFDRSVLKNIMVENHFPKIDLLFTGSLYVGGGFHKTRIDYLESLLSAQLALKIYGNTESIARVLSKIAVYEIVNFTRKVGLGRSIKLIPLLRRFESYGDTPIKFYSRKLKASMSHPVFGVKQFKLLSRSRICFNIHGEIAGGCAGNLRLFEATGVGSCLVTDWKENLPDLFEPDKEIVTYKSKEECIDKIKWLLGNPRASVKIAQAGQARTLKDHTIQNRVKVINEMISKRL